RRVLFRSTEAVILKSGTRLGPMPELPVPTFYRPERVGEVWRVPYEERAREAPSLAAGDRVRPAPDDQHRTRPGRAGGVWRVPSEERAREARSWAEEHGIRPAQDDDLRICLLAVDVQNTFCIPGFELFVGGRSGTGAVDDKRSLCELLYRNLGVITQIVPS